MLTGQILSKPVITRAARWLPCRFRDGSTTPDPTRDATHVRGQRCV